MPIGAYARRIGCQAIDVQQQVGLLSGEEEKAVLEGPAGDLDEGPRLPGRSVVFGS
jgi:hypothetical protein